MIETHCPPEKVLQAGQLIARQMDDDGVFVCLSLKDMRSSGQQYGPVCPEGAWAGIQGNIGLQLLLQQPGQITWRPFIRGSSDTIDSKPQISWCQQNVYFKHVNKAESRSKQRSCSCEMYEIWRLIWWPTFSTTEEHKPQSRGSHLLLPHYYHSPCFTNWSGWPSQLQAGSLLVMRLLL